jgi:tetratricopeptide (TPR) repeat protein
MLAKIEDILKRGKETDAPAYTLILGAGASFGVVPTAKEMLGFPDAVTKKVHQKSIPLWLASQIGSGVKLDDASACLECSKAFWKEFRAANAGNERCKGIEFDSDGLPRSASIAAAYQSVFDTACIGGLDTPERHRNYMRAVTMAAAPGSTQLNATHFYLASLLSLQKRPGDLGSDKKPFYTGRREFARTIFTTNFDPLLQTSLQLFQLLYYMTDRPEFLSADALQTDQHPAIHLFYAHGSVHRPYMASNAEQIALLKQQNARDLAAYLGNHGVIVLGYSGWDDCLLEALNQTKTFSNNLYWLARGAASISENVGKFLASHHNAYWVEIDDGGSFMADLHSRLCLGAPNTEMLYNPIRPLLCQLDYVNLTGIQSGGARQEKDTDKAVTSDAPRDVEAIRRQVIARLKDAQKLFTEPSSADGNLDELERQADLSFANNDWNAALDSYDRLLNHTLDLPVRRKALALIRRGLCYGEKGETDKEIADYTAVIEMPGAPVDQVAMARNNRAICYGQKGESDKAIADYTAVIGTTEAPVDEVTKARFNRGILYGEKGEMDKEIADYAIVIETTEAPAARVAKARFNRGGRYGEKGETDKEIADYTAIIEMSGVSVDQVTKARVNRGVCYADKGETDKAIADYTAVIEMANAPVDQVAVARFNRGIRYAEKGETDKEIADYTAVIEMTGAPVDSVATARINRGACYAEKGEKDKAIADYTAVVEMAGARSDRVEMAKKQLKALKPKASP